MQTVVTKERYAELKGRTPSAVSNWIAKGIITPAALRGTGVRARIILEQANADLAANLDPAQQAGQERPIVGGLGVGERFEI